MVIEVRADIASGDYRTALKKIDKELFPSSAGEKSGERYELLMLKGECKLQLKDRIGASSAFKAAAKAAGNVNELAAAHANALIIDRSASGRYSPRLGSGAEPIDILPMESRKRAMTALQGEIASQYKPQIEAALRADKLPPLEQVFPRIAEMFFLESFAIGEPTETGQLMRELGSHAFKLLQMEVSKCGSRVDHLNQLANSSGVTSRGWDSGRLGLTSQQRDELKTMLPYLVKMRDRASEYRRIAARAGGDPEKWDALVADTVETIADAESLYNDR